MNKIYNLLTDNNIITGAVIGTHSYHQTCTFLSGAGMILRRDVCKLLLDNKNMLRYDYYDDVAIGLILNILDVPFCSLLRFEAYNYTIENINKDIIKNDYHFRCKLSDQEYQVKMINHLIKLIYDI